MKVKRHDHPRYIPVRVTGKLDGIPVRPLVVGIEKFWNRYDEDGVKRTIKIDECDRKRVSRELAKHLKEL